MSSIDEQTRRNFLALTGASQREAELSALRARVAELEAVLKPFAAIAPSSLYGNDGSEQEGYIVVLYSGGRPKARPDFNGLDLARARAALERKAT